MLNLLLRSAIWYVLEPGREREISLAERAIREEVAIIKGAQPDVKGTDAILIGELGGQIGVGEAGEQALHADGG